MAARAELEQWDAWREERRLPVLRERVNPVPRWSGIWRGYWQLSGSRQIIVVPMGGCIPGAIEYSALSRWMADNRIEPCSAAWELHVACWEALDRVQAEHQRSQAAADEAKRKK